MTLLGAQGTQQRYRQAFQRGRIVEGVLAISCVFLSRGGSSVLSWDVMNLRLQSAAWRSGAVIQRDQALTGVRRSGSSFLHVFSVLIAPRPGRYASDSSSAEGEDFPTRALIGRYFRAKEKRDGERGPTYVCILTKEGWPRGQASCL